MIVKIFSGLSALDHLMVKSFGSLITALLLSWLCGDTFIALSKKKFRAKAREFTPKTHRAKDNIPTMGGLFILSVVTLTCLLWCDLSRDEWWLFFVIFLTFGGIGALDDWEKITAQKGISARYKFFLQIIAACTIMSILYYKGFCATIMIPLSQFFIDPGIFFIVWGAFIMVATSNAVNLTDGLDGLALGSLIPNFIIFALLAYAGSTECEVLSCSDGKEISVIASALMGACLGFLKYNAYPARIFMGDIGSLALGAALALLAILTKCELLLPLVGGLFVVEASSVILQVLSYKYRGKRIFRMAPIHHHFELQGWSEQTITRCFSFVSFFVCMVVIIFYFMC